MDLSLSNTCQQTPNMCVYYNIDWSAYNVGQHSYCVPLCRVYHVETVSVGCALLALSKHCVNVLV